VAEQEKGVNRRTAVLLGALVAALAAAEIVALSALLAAERRDDRERYAAAITRQRRAAGRTAPAPDHRVERASRPATFCVRGVDTFVATVHAGLHAQLLDDKGRLDVRELGQLSSLAIRAERYVEQASAGPGLPQRMGRTRVRDDQGQTAWKPLEPTRSECDDGEGYAAFRLDVRDIERSGTATDPDHKAAPARPPDVRGKQTPARQPPRGKTRQR
jgi:hypothetical protein